MIKNCGICGNEFDALSSAKYCSKECYNLHRNKESKIKRSIKTAIKICAICSKEILLVEGGITPSKYCSKECASSGKSIRWKETHKDDKEKRKEYFRNYRDANKERINAKSKKYRGEHEEYSKNYVRHRRKNDVNFKLRDKLSYFLRRILKDSKIDKFVRDYIDYTPEQLRLHLESQFKEGMSWDNHGKFGWHIDHIKPISKFNFFDVKGNIIIEEIKGCMSLDNLQPLWWNENISKGNRYN